MSPKLAIAWIDLKFSVHSMFSKTEKIILNYLNGSLEFESITALMGSNGSGKTILLKCLNGSNKCGLGKETQIYLSKEEKIRTCFISQDPNQHLLNGLQVKESLIYASKLKNSDCHEKVDHELNINTLMSELMISETANTNVENCSGGQQKRLSIALELTSIRKPNLLLIDEPTSGLDSDSAQVVIESLKSLSRNHRIAIMTSIHQPNNQMLQVFDNLYVLAKGGVCIYWGRPQDLNINLRQSDITIKEFEAPIQVLLKISTKGLSDRNVRELSDRTSEAKQTLIQRCNEETKLFADGIPQKKKRFKLIDLWYLLIRSMIYNYLVNWKLQLLQPIINLTFALFLHQIFGSKMGEIDGCFILNHKSNTSCFESLNEESLLEQNQGFQYNAILLFLMIQMISNTLSFSSELKIFFSEHLNVWYSTGTYYWAKTIVQFIPLVLNASIYSVTVYYMSGQMREFDRFSKYFYVITAAMLCNEAMGSLFGIIGHRNEKLPLILSCGTYMLTCILANFFIPVKHFNNFIQFFSELCYTKYVYNSALVVIYGFDRCPQSQTSLVLHNLDINDSDIFWKYAKYFIYNFTALKVLGLISLIFEANDISFRALFKRKSRNNSSNELSIISSHRMDQNFILQRYQYENKSFTRQSNDLSNSEDISFGQILDHKLIMAWIDLSLTVSTNFFGEKNRILNQISGCFEFGSLNALMGSSGAGKTTLLRCLNGRSNSGLSEETKIFLNKNHKIRSCFICQDVRQHLLNGLTVRQTLIYASKMKNSMNSAKVDHEYSVNSLLSELGISDIAETNVENCSGGQHKRIVIATELTSFVKPNLLCIDEPTSGLDSESAEIVIKTLKILSRKHEMAIITSIHQPNDEILNTFDNLYILAKGGICVYSGSPQQLNAHLRECGITCSGFDAPIQVLLKISSKGLSDENVKQSYNKTLIQKIPLIQRCSDEKLVFSDGIHMKSKTFQPIDIWYLLLRNITYIVRYQWKVMLFEFFFYQFVAFCLKVLHNSNMIETDGCMQFNGSTGCHQSEEELEQKRLLSENLKFHASEISFVLFMQTLTSTIVFTTEVKLFFNEYRNGWYSTGAYYITKSMFDFIPTSITIACLCWVMNFYGSRMYFSYLWIFLLGSLCSQSIGHILGIVFNENDKMALLLSVGSFVFSSVFANFFVPIKQLPKILQWISNVSVFKFVFENLVLLIYGFDHCDNKGFSTVLYKIDIDDDQFLVNSIILFVYFITFRSVAILILAIQANSFSFRRRVYKPNIVSKYSAYAKSEFQDTLHL